MTSQIVGRVWQHREETTGGFTARYNVKRLVWFEVHKTMDSAIRREKSIKRWLREWKIALIEDGNPTWRDLAEDFGFDSIIKDRWIPAQGRDDGGC